MASVTQRIKSIEQPYGGYVNPNRFSVVELPDTHRLYQTENVSPSLVGTVVDYMTRLACGDPPDKVFGVSMLGAYLAKEEARAASLLAGIQGFDDASIANACRLAEYDQFSRRNLRGTGTREIPKISPNQWTTDNIKMMVNRAMQFFKRYGPVVCSGFTFQGGYTQLVDSGDGDFLTEDTLWDFKVSKRELTKDTTLQLICYYILGKRSTLVELQRISKVGAFNPRLNKVYLLQVADLERSTLEAVAREVLGCSFNGP